MFQRINKRKNLIDNIHEDDDESERSGAGNETSLLNNLLTNESNEANNNLIENLDELSDAESDHEANAPLEIEGLDRIPSFDFDSNTDYATTKAVRRFKGKPRKTSNKTDNKPVINLIENVIDEDEKSKRSNSSKISQISADRKSRVSENSANDSQNISNNEDLDEVNNEMQPAAGWDFEAVKLPARKKANWFSKFLTRVAYYTGKSVGKIAGALSHLFTGGWKFWSRMSARSKNKAAPQQKRDHESIPGWDGAKWEGYEQRDDGLDIDFRRVPAVWSYPTAAKAEKAPDVPEDPVISIYVSQPRSGEDVIDANANSSGHSGIGIEFSRKSNITGEWERYNLRFGYYMAGGISLVPATAVMAYNRALVPGQLMDERNRKYDISRSYKINNHQVNAVLKAAETYPDKGYNNFTRNCTTFAKEMVVNHAHVPAGDAIFQKEGIDYSSKQNFMLMGVGAFSQWNKAGMEQNLTKLTSGEDTNYQGYGNKRMTREEYDQYHKSLGFFRGTPTEADTPNGAAENMRRLEGPDRGTVGSFNWKGDGVISPIAALTRMTMAADDIRPILQQITPADKLEDEHYQNAVKWVSEMGKSLNGVDDFSDITSKEEFREIRANLTEDIDNLNTVLFDYYKNDKRLHLPIMNAISLLTAGILGVDEAYRSFMERTGVEEDELNNIRVSFLSNKYDIVFNGKNTLEMSPSLYEAYLQVYKTPNAAVRDFLRFNELSQINENFMTPEMKKEYQKLSRMQALVREFEKSHRYMLEKKAYTQQDVDYAFALEKKEKSTPTGGDMISQNRTASSTYKTLFLEKIFGGMKERYRNYRDNRGKSVGGGDRLLMGKWLDDELYNCASSKKDEIKMILNSIMKSMDKVPDRYKLAFEFQYFVKEHWIKKLYDQDHRDSEEYNDLFLALDSIRSGGKFRYLLDDLVDEVIDDYKKLNAGRESVHSEDDEDDED